MNKKFGLGKGLEALIPTDVYSQSDDNSVTNISTNLIKANENQPRKYFDENKIFQLSESIKEYGIVQPLVLKKDGDFYTIIAGERRWRAAKNIGLKEVPAVILEADDKRVLEISLIENIQREDLNPIEEANAYKQLIDNFNLTQEELSRRVGKSRSAITNCLRLLNLDSRVQEYLVEGVLSEGHGRALLAVEDNELQYKIAQTVIDNSLNVRDTEKLIKNYSMNKKKKSNIDDTLNPYIKTLKEKLETHFGTKVLVTNKNNKGKIEIEYYSMEDLQRILDLLKA